MFLGLVVILMIVGVIYPAVRSGKRTCRTAASTCPAGSCGGGAASAWRSWLSSTAAVRPARSNDQAQRNGRDLLPLSNRCPGSTPRMRDGTTAAMLAGRPRPGNSPAKLKGPPAANWRACGAVTGWRPVIGSRSVGVAPGGPAGDGGVERPGGVQDDRLARQEGLRPQHGPGADGGAAAASRAPGTGLASRAVRDREDGTARLTSERLCAPIRSRSLLRFQDSMP